MKQFIKDQGKAILFFYSQVILIIFVAQLAAYNAHHPMSLGTLGYLLLLPTCFLILFLFLRYAKFRAYYQFQPNKIKTDIGTWLPEAPNELLHTLKRHYEHQYKEYQNEIETLRFQQAQQLTFIQQWVHQVKTPLSVINLIVQKERQEGAPSSSSLESIEEEIDKIKNGVELVLYQSRLQKFERDFYIEKLNLNAFVKELIKAFKSSFIRHRVFPLVDIDSALYVYTDHKWMHFALSQIVSNAIKYSPNDSCKIYFKSKVIGDRLELTIKDEGVGIPSQDLPRVFDPFYTGQNGRFFQESTGMGLYLVKQIVDALDHQISITSEKNKGTTLSIIFQNLTKV